MKQEHISYFCGFTILAIIIIALFNNPQAKHLGAETWHEVKTFDAWKQSAFAGNPGEPAYPQCNITPAAFTQQAPPIMMGDAPPVLIKELGIEVTPTSGGKAKISGVMGSSWADKAGLKKDDIILRFNKKKLEGVKHFKQLVKQAPPEKDYEIKLLRNGKVESLRVIVGEGEMDGFVPIVQVAFGQPMAQNQQIIHYAGNNGAYQGAGQHNGANNAYTGRALFSNGTYQCVRCGNFLVTNANGPHEGPNCPVCRAPMRRRIQ